MNVVMVHPIHGAKVAINQTELEMDEQNGWTRYNPETTEQVVPEIEKPTVKRKYTRKIVEPLTTDEQEFATQLGLR